MASKEATVIVLETSAFLNQKRQNRNKTDFEYTVEYVLSKVSDIIIRGRKSDVLGIVAYRTEDTDNSMSTSSAGYNNISVWLPMSEGPSLGQLQEIQERLRIPSTNRNGDPISALIVALDMINNFCGGRKYRKRIIMTTSGEGSLDSSDMEKISQTMNTISMKLM